MVMIRLVIRVLFLVCRMCRSWVMVWCLVVVLLLRMILILLMILLVRVSSFWVVVVFWIDGFSLIVLVSIVDEVGKF